MKEKPDPATVAAALLPEKWFWSKGEEVWPSEPTFASREQAVAAGCKGMKNGTFYTGKAEAIDMEAMFPDADDILETISCRLGDNVGEVAEDWGNASREEKRELSNELFYTFMSWAKRHGHIPEFYKIADTRTHRVVRGKVVEEGPF